MNQEIRVLLVEDSLEDTILLITHLQQGGFQVVYERVDTCQKMSAALDGPRWDIVLSDFTLPQFDAMSALHLLRQKRPDVPFIIVSGTIGEDRAVAAMRAGASDYISKEKLARLVPAIERSLKEAQVRLRERELIVDRQMLLERFQMILDRMPIGCVVTDHQFRFVYWNSAAERIFGFKSNEVIGKHPFDVIVPEKEQAATQELFDRVRNGDMAAHRPSENVTRDRRAILCDWHNTPSHQADGTFTGIISMCQDITEQRSLEDQLRQAQRMESIGRLAGGIAHDFNNLLTVVLGYSHQLLTERQLAPAENEACKHIHSAAERAGQLTRQLLAFSRRQVLQPQVLDLNELVANLTKLLARVLGEDLALSCKYSSIPSVIHADPGMIEQVIMNLAVNAREAMPSGGELLIQTSVVKIGADYVATHPDAHDGNHVCLTVSDTGCGISEADLPRIFEPFFTTKDVGKGIGLGLATVFGIVQQHQGWIEVSSTVGRGTSFHIFLPAEAVEERPGLRPPHESSRCTNTATLLWVEDQPDIRELVQDSLEQRGYRVLTAQSGPEALEVWHEHNAKIDLLITDVMMPGGMSGIELVQRLRQERPELKTILVSGYAADGLPDNLKAHFIQKPFEVHELAQAIRGTLAGQGAIPLESRFAERLDDERIPRPVRSPLSAVLVQRAGE